METKKKFTLKDIPGGYAMCTRNDCKVCEHCLRHIAYNDVGKELKRLMIVNPLLVVASEQCEFFRTNELATYAKGFVRMKDEMLPRQYDEFMVRPIVSLVELVIMSVVEVSDFVSPPKSNSSGKCFRICTCPILNSTATSSSITGATDGPIRNLVTTRFSQYLTGALQYVPRRTRVRQ